MKHLLRFAFPSMKHLPAWLRATAGIGSDVVATTPEEFARWLARDRERYGVVIRDANIRIE